jgi:hypothetical protein
VETLKCVNDVSNPKVVHFTMLTGDTHAENRPALFSLPETAPAAVLRVGELLKASGHPAAAIEIYENFIAGLRVHALAPRAAEESPDIFPVHAHPERYTLA